jgi:lysozyme family protein
MASFQPAVQNTELWEGGYSNNPSDSGGETYRGISRANWPEWNGWVLVDQAKGQSGFPSSLDSNSGLQSLVVSFYQQNYWHYDGINDQLVADKIFDLAVNVGQRHAVMIAQMSVGVTQDGVYGPATEAAINATSNGSLLPLIRQNAEQYHEQIAATHPQDAMFLKGWLRRDSS